MTSPPWWRARSLAERARDTRAAEAGEEDASGGPGEGCGAPDDGSVAGGARGGGGPGEACGAPDDGSAAGGARARRWEQALPDPEILAERLREAGADGVALDAVLTERPPPADAREPEWWRWIAQTLAPGTRSPVRDGDDERDADALHGSLRLVAPFAGRVRADLREHPAARADAVRLLTHNVAFELAELCRPAVAMELAATRAAERWTARTTPARAATLLRSLGGAEEALALFAEHPGLARMVACRARLAVEAGRELLERLDADLERVRAELLGGGDLGPITALDPAGDSHDGGRRVMRVGFQSGAQVALKPRSLAPDLAFQRLLAELTRLGFEPGFRVLATIAAGPRHGWQEWARPSDCDSPACVGRYYRRLGGQLALLHALHGVDLHQENVLACGEDPVLVDLEGTLHPRLGGERAGVVDPLIAETGMDCVLRVGLLPRADVAFGVDIGGLGRDPRGRVSVTELRWVGEGGDAHLAEQSVRLDPGANAPRLRGEVVRPQEHVDGLARGFADAYRLLVAHRETLLAPGGALDAFGDLPIRFILRPTKVYSDLLRRQSSDPGALDDGLVREEALNALWRGALRRPDLRIAAAAEHHDLWHGDVPKITGAPGSADGHHHALGALEGLLGPHPAPAPEVVRRLDADDLERQQALLRASVLAAAAPAEVPPVPAACAAPAEVPSGPAVVAEAPLARVAAVELPLPSATAVAAGGPHSPGAATADVPQPPAAGAAAAPPRRAGASAKPRGPAGAVMVAPYGGASGVCHDDRASPPSRGELLDSALAAARRLGVLALRDGDHAGWLTPVSAPGHPGRVLRAAGPGLVEGQAGIALFLALATAATGDKPTAALAPAAVRRLLAQLDADQAADAGIGLRAGAGGALLALACLATALDDDTLRSRGRDLAAELAERAATDQRLELADGLAGWIVGLAALEPAGSLREQLEHHAVRLAGAQPPADPHELRGRGFALARARQALGDPDRAGRAPGDWAGARRTADPHPLGAPALAAPGASSEAARLAALGASSSEPLDAGPGASSSMARLAAPGASSSEPRDPASPPPADTSRAVAGDSRDAEARGASTAVETPGLNGGIAGAGLSRLVLLDQIAADAAAAASLCSAP